MLFATLVKSLYWRLAALDRNARNVPLVVSTPAPCHLHLQQLHKNTTVHCGQSFILAAVNIDDRIARVEDHFQAIIKPRVLKLYPQELGLSSWRNLNR